jgi:hypothetical protein
MFPKCDVFSAAFTVMVLYAEVTVEARAQMIGTVYIFNLW